MFVYQISPIDFWEGCTLLEDYVKNKLKYLTEHKSDIKLCFEPYSDLRDILEFYREAQKIAIKYGDFKNEDLKDGPYISGIPREDVECAVIIMWKQNNNGTTYVASQIELPWLKDDMIFQT